LREHLDSNTRPEPLSLITFEGKFKKRLDIEYSNYLTFIYGFKEPMEYSDSVKGKVASWNRLLKRLKDINEGKKTATGKETKLTPKNEIAIAEMASEGWNAQELAAKAKLIEDEENEES
jgi:hypothetical protein